MTDRTPDMMPTGTRQASDRTVLSVPEAAAHFGVTPDAIRARLHRGTLKGEKVAGEWRVYLPAEEIRLSQENQIHRQDTDTTLPVDRQDAQQDATGTKQDADTPPLLQQVVAAKDETIESQRREIEFLRAELETRTDELQRRDVLLREALGRIPQLAPGETRVDPLVSPQDAPGSTETPKTSADTPESAPVVDRPKWWEFWRR